MRQRSLRPLPKSRPGLTGPISGWRRGFTSIGREQGSEAAHPGNLSSRPLSLLFFLVLYFSVLAQDHVQGYLIFLVFFRGCTNCVKPVFCGGRQTICSWRQATWKLKPSNKWFAVPRLETDGLHDLLQGIMTQPDLSKPVGLPLLKRHRWVHPATVLTPLTQEPKATASIPLVQEFEGAHQSRGSSLSVPQPKEATIPNKMATLYINMGDTKWIYCCQV